MSDNRIPRTVYSTTATPQSSSQISQDSPYPVLFHDNSNITFHDNSHMAFHNYYQADLDSSSSLNNRRTPRVVYSGEVEI